MKNLKVPGIILLIYGVLVLFGGIMGHVKAASRASLVSGLVCGSLLMLNSWVLFKNKIFGIYIAFILTFLLDAFFTYRFSSTHKFFPSGMMSFISLMVLLGLALSVRKKQGSPSV